MTVNTKLYYYSTVYMKSINRKEIRKEKRSCRPEQTHSFTGVPVHSSMLLPWLPCKDPCLGQTHSKDSSPRRVSLPSCERESVSIFRTIENTRLLSVLLCAITDSVVITCMSSGNLTAPTEKSFKSVTCPLRMANNISYLPPNDTFTSTLHTLQYANIASLSLAHIKSI